MPSVSPTLRIRVLFFGRIRELLGIAEEAEEVPAGATPADLFQHYARRQPRLEEFRPSLVVTRNQEFAAWDISIHDGDEIAFLPPVSGG